MTAKSNSKNTQKRKPVSPDPPPDPELQMMAYLDGELSPEDARDFEAKLENHPEWREELKYLADISDVANQLSYKPLRKDFWDGYWDEIEPQLAPKKRFLWSVMVAGLGLVLLYLYFFIITFFENALWQIGSSLILFGGTFLFIIISRAQLQERQKDRYRKVKR